MHTTPAYTQQPHQSQPSMADMWAEFPAEPGQLVGAVTQSLAAHAPLVPVHVAPAAMAAAEPVARPRPYRDTLAWSAVKLAVQLALVVSVVIFVIEGGRAPLMALGYVGTALLLMAAMVVADRERFCDRDPAFEIVEFITPAPAASAAQSHAPVVHHAPLTPLAQQMQVAMPERVSVT